MEKIFFAFFSSPTSIDISIAVEHQKKRPNVEKIGIEAILVSNEAEFFT